MVPESAMAMLACARLGAVHVVVFGGFAANELAVRIDHVRPKVVLSATCGLEAERVVPYLSLLEDALSACAHEPDACVILERPQAPSRLRAGRDHDWHEALGSAEPVGCVPVGATDPLYVLHTSGTTGRPKGVVRDNGGHAVALELSMDLVYDMQPGDVFWAASDIGWVVGHSYTVYGPLLRGCTSVLYEGKPVGTPDAGAFWRVLEEHGVNALFAAPTALRAIKQADPDGKLLSGRALDRFRTLFVAGERCDTDTLHWARNLLGVPVIDHWWQTETGWAICANPMGLGALPVKPGSPTKAMPGYDVHAVDEQGADLPAGEVGAIVIREPLPPAGLLTLWEDDDAYLSAYMTEHPGFYTTGDAGAVDEDG
jgi:propionyl-CoA synthetase